MEKDVRWLQRFENFQKAFHQLEKFIIKSQYLNELETQGLIQCFEYCYELAWNTIKDFYENQGESNIQGSKDAIRLAFKRGLISDGEGWMQMLADRNQTSHSYDENLAQSIRHNIQTNYFTLFLELINNLKKIENKL